MELKKNTLLFFLASITTYTMEHDKDDINNTFDILSNFLTENRDKRVTNNIKNNTFITEIHKINTLHIKDIIAIKNLSGEEKYNKGTYDNYEWFNRHIIEFLYTKQDPTMYSSLLFLCSMPNKNANFKYIDYINGERKYNESSPNVVGKKKKIEDTLERSCTTIIDPLERYNTVVENYINTSLPSINTLSDIELINLYGMTDHINTMIYHINKGAKNENKIELPQLQLCTYKDINNPCIKIQNLDFFIEKYCNAGLIILDNHLYKQPENIDALLDSNNKNDIIDFINYIITEYNNIIQNQHDINNQKEVGGDTLINTNADTRKLRTKDDIEYCPPSETSVQDKNMKNNRHFLYTLTAGTAAIGVLIYYIIDYKKYYQTILEYTSNINNKISWNNLFY
jgi:hypothetical protein